MEWGSTTKQAVETLLKAMIVLSDGSPFSQELRDLADRAGVALSPDLLSLATG